MQRKGLELQRDIIMDHFDFDKVYRHMIKTDRRYWDGNDTITPTYQDLKVRALDKLDNVIDYYEKGAGIDCVAGGGFCASIERLPDGVFLQLSFVVTDMNIYDIKTDEEVEMLMAIYKD